MEGIGLHMIHLSENKAKEHKIVIRITLISCIRTVKLTQIDVILFNQFVPGAILQLKAPDP